MAKSKQDLGRYLDEVVYPAMYHKLDTALPDFGFERRGNRWVATNEATTRTLPGGPRPDRVNYDGKKPGLIGVHGEKPVRVLELIGGQNLRGIAFIEAVQKLCDLVGVARPTVEETEEQRQRRERLQKREDLLEAVVKRCRDILSSDQGAHARKYLAQRGLDAAAIDDLELGYYLYDEVKTLAADADVPDSELPSGGLWPKLDGFVVYPWRDEYGRLLNLYGRWPAKDTPHQKDANYWKAGAAMERLNWQSSKGPFVEPQIPKLIGLPGEGNKRSPLYFDRARQDPSRDVVLVEGINDAAVLQSKGDLRVVAMSGATLSQDQLETLASNKVRNVFLCGDPDQAGIKGTESNVRRLMEKGLAVYVVPTLPDNMDPDEFVLAKGIDEWRNLVDRSDSGLVYIGKRTLDGITPDCGEARKRDAVVQVLSHVTSATGAWAKDDEVRLLELLEDTTGYSQETLESVHQEVEEAARRKDKERKLERLVTSVSSDIAKGRAFNDVVSDLVAEATSLRILGGETGPQWFNVDRLVEETRRTPPGLSSGWKSLDAIEVAFNPGELSLIAARTGHGKTSFLVGLLWNWLQSTKGTVVFYSHEEPEVRIFHRLVSLASKQTKFVWSGAEVRDFVRNPQSRGDKYKWPGRADDLNASIETLRRFHDRLVVVHRPSWSAADIAGHAQQLAQEGGVGAVLVDYLQRIPAIVEPGQRFDRRDQEVSDIARRLKALSVGLNVPVVAGAQINRSSISDSGRKEKPSDFGKFCEVWKNYRPELHHLREGGSEQEADQVLGLLNYAADYRTDGDNSNALDAAQPTPLDVGTLKNRYGSQGRWATLDYAAKCGAITDQARSKWDL